MADIDPAPVPRAGAAAIVVTFAPEVDMASAACVGGDLDAAFGPGVGVVVADLSGTWFCDSSGIHARVMAYQRTQVSNTELRVLAGQGPGPPGAGTIAPGHGPALYPRLDMALVAKDGESADGLMGPGAGGRRRTLPASEAPMMGCSG